MAWSSTDQNPSLSPSAAYGQTDYAATLNNAADYDPMGSGVTMGGGSSVAPSSAPTGQTNYADRLGAAGGAAPAKPVTTSAALAKSATPQPAKGSQAAREIQAWGGGGSRFEIAGKAAGNIGDVNGALVDIMRKAAEGSNYNVQLFSGKREGDRRQHGRGHAVDIALVDPYSGEPLANYQSAETFPQYETFARKAYEIAQRDYPELASNFRWGGYFAGGKGKYGAVDNMHFDVKSGMGMAGGSFEGGLTPDQQRRVDRMGSGRTQWAGLRPGTTEAPPPTRYAGNPFGVGEGGDALAGGTAPPQPRMRPGRTEMAYAPSPETMDAAPFDAVLAASRDRRPQPPSPQANPRRDRLQAPAPALQGGGAYVVQAGDNLTKISRQFGVSVEEIARANGIRDVNRIAAGQRLAIPGGGQATAPAPRQPANVPQPRQRPSREVAMPTPPARPDMRIERQAGGAPDAGTVPQPQPRPQTPRPVDPSRYEMTGITPGERLEQRRRGGPVAPMSEMDRSMGTVLANRDMDRLARGMNERLGNPETRMSIERSARTGTPVYGNAAAVNRAAKGEFEGRPAARPASPPAGPGMDTSGLIREPTPEERALRGGRMPLPTNGRPIDPAIASQIRQTPVVIVDPRSPPVYVSPSGVRIWAAR